MTPELWGVACRTAIALYLIAVHVLAVPGAVWVFNDMRASWQRRAR